MKKDLLLQKKRLSLKNSNERFIYIIYKYYYMSVLRGQRREKCQIVGCEEYGRTLAKIGGVDIVYCPKHRKKYGERIINALINSCFNYKLTNFLSEIKTDIFFGSDILDEACGSRLKNYIHIKTSELENILEFADKNDIEKYNIENEKEN